MSALSTVVMVGGGSGVHDSFLVGGGVHGVVLHAVGGSGVRVLHAAPPSIRLWTLSGVIRTEWVV